MEIVAEEWRSIPDHEGYEVSNLGNVRSVDRIAVRRNGRSYRHAGKRLNPSMVNSGYLTAMLTNRQRRTVHGLVCSAFIGPRPECSDVNHKDGNKLNNRVENLEYVTRAENMAHARETGLFENRGDRSPMAKVSENDVLEIRTLRASGVSLSQLSRRFGISSAQIIRIVRRERWSHVA